MNDTRKKLEVFGLMMEKDPVCDKILDTDKEFRHARYKVRDFYFCSDKCAQRFESNPDIYIDFEM